MSLVIDASVAFKWFVPEPASEQALLLLDMPTQLIAPDLMLLEVSNAMWARLRGRENFVQIVADATSALPQMFDRVAATGELVPRALEMAIELNHPLYDCVYLALAERDDLRLVTADRNFIGKVQTSAFSELIVALEMAGQ